MPGKNYKNVTSIHLDLSTFVVAATMYDLSSVIKLKQNNPCISSPFSIYTKDERIIYCNYMYYILQLYVLYYVVYSDVYLHRLE